MRRLMMSDPIETKTIGQYTIEIHLDPDPENPRTEYDQLGTMACWHRRYTLGDIQPSQKPWEYQRDLYTSGAFYLSVYLYDHSGLTISTTPFSCPWDSGQVGYISISKKKAKAESPKLSGEALKAWAEDRLRSEVEEYDRYLRGEAYGFIIKDENDEELDSCWEFDSIESAIEAAEEVIPNG
jgi:hypothetical protein